MEKTESFFFSRGAGMPILKEWRKSNNDDERRRWRRKKTKEEAKGTESRGSWRNSAMSSTYLHRHSWELRLLTCGHNGTGLSAVVGSANNVSASGTSCLFNVGDSTQRFCGENRIKLARVSCVVITSLAPHNVAGLPGLLLLLSDSVSVYRRYENKSRCC